MSDMKSKFPDLKELASMTNKLYTDIKASVGQIIQDYKDIRAKAEEEVATKDVKPENESVDETTSEENKK